MSNCTSSRRDTYDFYGNHGQSEVMMKTASYNNNNKKSQSSEKYGAKQQPKVIKESFRDLRQQFSSNITTSSRKTAEESYSKMKYIKKKEKENKVDDQCLTGDFDTK